MNYKNYFTVFLFTLLIAGCTKNKTATEPDIPGTATITSLSTIAIYLNGTDLKIAGTMTDNNVLASARVEVKNKTSNAILFQQNTPTGNVTYFAFDWTWRITGVTSSIIVIVKVVAIDKLGNETSKEMEIKLDS